VIITYNAAIAAVADEVIRLADGCIIDVEHKRRERAARELSW
jgi:hypothetical protein